MNICRFVCVCASFPFCFEGGMWDLIVVFPDHCLSIYFAMNSNFFPISHDMSLMKEFKITQSLPV